MGNAPLSSAVAPSWLLWSFHVASIPWCSKRRSWFLQFRLAASCFDGGSWVTCSAIFVCRKNIICLHLAMFSSARMLVYSYASYYPPQTLMSLPSFLWQMRDLIVHIETQNTVDELPGSVSSDIKGGTVLPVPAASSSSSSNGARRASRNRRRNWAMHYSFDLLEGKGERVCERNCIAW